MKKITVPKNSPEVGQNMSGVSKYEMLKINGCSFLVIYREFDMIFDGFILRFNFGDFILSFHNLTYSCALRWSIITKVPIKFKKYSKKC